MKTLLYVLLVILAFDRRPVAEAKIYEAGRLVAVSPKFIESPAPVGGGVLPPPQILLGYSFEVSVGSFTYFVDASLCCPLRSRYKLEWATGDPIEFRFDKNRMLIRRPSGKELPAKLVKVVPNSSRPTLSTQLGASGPQFQPLSEKAQHGKRVPLGLDFLRADDMCLLLDANIEGGDFFDQLRWHKTKNGIEFRKDTQIVEAFPDSLIVRLIAALGTCTANERRVEGRDLTGGGRRLDEGFMKSVTFVGSWKHGFDEKPAEFGPMAEGRIPNPTPIPNNDDWWEFEFKVSSKDVSLNDSLVIVVQSPDGKMVARLSYRLPNGL